jgi:hypothetical protein
MAFKAFADHLSSHDHVDFVALLLQDAFSEADFVEKRSYIV